MSKKKLLFFLMLSVICSASESKIDPWTSCAFCQKEILDRQKFYEEDLVIVLYTHKPIEPCHILILPKRHVERYEELTEEELIQISQVTKRVNIAASSVFETSSYLIHQKNGKEVGQSVPHVHFHYIGRKQGDDSSIKFAIKLLYAQIRGPISQEEMKDKISALTAAIKKQNNIDSQDR